MKQKRQQEAEFAKQVNNSEPAYGCLKKNFYLKIVFLIKKYYYISIIFMLFGHFFFHLRSYPNVMHMVGM